MTIRLFRQMPILRLPAEHLTAPHLHFASVTLTFLTHFYIHSHPPPTSSLAVPPSLSIPLNQVSELLGLPPVLTYATSVLYNVLAPSPTEVFSLSNPPMTARQTFTGLESEVQFYVVSSLIELHGVRALGIMRAALDEAFVGDKLALRRISAGLRSLAGAITDLTEVMRGMRKRCDPEEFYWLIRPWFKVREKVFSQFVELPVRLLINLPPFFRAPTEKVLVDLGGSSKASERTASASVASSVDLRPDSHLSSMHSTSSSASTTPLPSLLLPLRLSTRPRTRARRRNRPRL